MSNPYTAPAAGYRPARGAGPDDFVTRRMVSVASESRVWTLALAVLLLLLVGLSTAAVVLTEAAADVDDAQRLPLLLFKLAVVVVNYGLPGVLLFAMSQHLGSLVLQPHTPNLLGALRSQRTYWTAMGVLSLLWLIGLIVQVSLWVVHADSEIEWLRQMTQ